MTVSGEGILSRDPWPRAIAVVWLMYFLIAFLGVFLGRGIVISGDAASTATNIIAHANLYRAAISADFLANAFYLALTALLYGLFRPVNRTIALMAAFFGLAGCFVQIVGELLRVAPTVVLTNAALAGVFSAQQLQASAVFSLALYNNVFHFSFVLFALFELVTGFLIIESTFLPKWLGWWWVLSGVVWLTFLWPPFAVRLRYLIPVSGAAELALLLWLLVKGVGPNQPFWRSKTG